MAPFISNLIKSSILMGNCLLNSQNLCFKNWFCIIGRRKKSINSEESLWFPINKNVWLGLIYTPSSLLSVPVLSVHSYVLKQPGLIIECLEYLVETINNYQIMVDDENKNQISCYATRFWKTAHTIILEYFNIKNKHFLILPSSLSRYSSAPKMKRIFQMLWCIFEGRTKRVLPSQPFGGVHKLRLQILPIFDHLSTSVYIG